MDFPKEITYGDIVRIRTETDINLLAIVDKQGTTAVWKELCDNLELQFRVLEAWLRPTYTAAGQSLDDFMRALAGEAFAAAFDALMEALDFFFKATRTSHVVGAIWNRAKRFSDSSGAEAASLVSSVSDDSLRARLKNSSGGGPGSAESAPTSTPTGNLS